MAPGGGSGEGQPEMAKISEADFERVLGKRYVRPVNAHGALAQARPPTPVPQAIDAGQQDVDRESTWCVWRFSKKRAMINIASWWW